MSHTLELRSIHRFLLHSGSQWSYNNQVIFNHTWQQSHTATDDLHDGLTLWKLHLIFLVKPLGSRLGLYKAVGGQGI